MCCDELSIPIRAMLAEAGERADTTTIQTVIMSKDTFKSEAAARAWISKNGFRQDKIDVTSHSYRFRQFSPDNCQDNSERTITLTKGVEAVVCRKKEGRAMAKKAYPAKGIQVCEGRMQMRRLTADEILARSYNAEKLDRDAAAEAAKTGVFEIAISSEAEVSRWYGIEILSHDQGAIDMKRYDSGAAVLLDHDRTNQVGVIVPGSARIDGDRVMRADIRFSSSVRGQEVQQDVQEGIRQNVSVGYYPKETKLEGQREVGADSSGKPISVDVWRVTRWQPAEVSIVSIPADVTVGVGREEDAGPTPAVEVGDPNKEERKMPELKEQERLAAEAESTAKARIETRNKEIGEILAMCDANGLAKKAGEWIAEGITAGEAATRILAERKTKGEGQPSSDQLEGLGKDRKRYSYARAIRIGAGLHPEASRDEEFRAVKFDGLEAEVHQELRRKMPAGIEYRGGVLVPMDTRSDDERFESRTHATNIIGKGPELVREVPGEFIELLRKRAAVLSLGARTLTGLTGPVAFPKQTGGFTVYWVGENPAADVSESDVALGLVNLTMKTLQGAASYSRQLLIQASMDVEAMVRDELAIGHGLAIDLSVIHGQGAAGEPTGIYAAPDVTITSVGGTITYAKLVDMATAVAESNADLGTLGYLTTPGIAGTLKKTLEFPSAPGGQRIWDGTYREGVVGGYRAVATQQVSSTMVNSAPTGGTEHGIIFGNWAEVIVGLFGALELIVDPYAKKKRGLIEVASFQGADHILRHGQSFNKSHGATK